MQIHYHKKYYYFQNFNIFLLLDLAPSQQDLDGVINLLSLGPPKGNPSFPQQTSQSTPVYPPSSQIYNPSELYYSPPGNII